MPSIAELLMPIALILPVAGLGAGNGVHNSQANAPGLASSNPAHTGDTAAPSAVRDAAGPAAETSLSALIDRLLAYQVRIEQRLYVRITPRTVSNRRNMLAQLPVRPPVNRYEEETPRRCIRVDEIAGVETGSGNRLLLFLNDAKVMSLNLEKACRARDFYSGFYVERNDDGKLCVERDTLQSRNGARCDIERMMQLAKIED